MKPEQDVKEKKTAEKEKRSRKKRMKRDCCRFMASAIAASVFRRLINVAAPTAAAWMIGDMADHLLALDAEAIAAGMAPFLCAVLFQVVIAPLLDLEICLLQTRKGFAYDGFLMEKFIRLPLCTVKTTDAGSVMERLEEDSAAFCWNQQEIYSLPGVILAYAAVFGYVMQVNRSHILFAAVIVLLAALPVVRAARIGKRQTELKRAVSEYRDARKKMEQELYDARDFAKSFSLGEYFIHRLDSQFQKFLAKTGKTQSRMEAKTAVLDFLCGYGVQLGAVLAGALLISVGKLTLGALLGGYLMIPSVRLCCRYVRIWITELHDEKKYLDRLAFFYEPGEKTGEDDQMLTVLEAKGLSFTYPGSAVPALNEIDFSMTDRENCRLTGVNGSGKSTLLSILGGLYEADAGEVCGKASLSQRRRSAALQEQDGAVFSGTVWDNLFLSEDRRSEAERFLNEMGVEKALDDEVSAGGGNLSPGERKKILLARAVLRETPFLLLDEPLNHLDERGRRGLYHRLASRKGGLLLVSHEDFPEGLCLRTQTLERSSG